MKLLKLAVGVLGLALVTGCANKAAQDYYLAMQQAAVANAQQSEARYRALATVASSGDQSAAIAATMAIAMTDDKTIAPQYIESQGLKWAQVLAAPVAAVTGMYIQADVAKNASDNAAAVQLANFRSNEAIQLGQQSMVTNLGSQWSATAAAGGQAVADLGVAGFNALNTAGGQTVELGTAGLQTVGAVSTSGFDTINNVSTTGFESAVTLGQSGMTGIQGTAELGFGSVNGLVTDYTSVIQDYNATIEAIFPTSTIVVTP